jgi:hypothetical protein
MSPEPSNASRQGAARATSEKPTGEPRALALLGDTPLVTLVDHNDPGTCLSVRLVRAGGAWFGVIDDGAALLDRVRMGLKPGFVVHHDAHTPTISGEVEVRIVGRADGAASTAPAVGRLLADQPFGLARAVVVEVIPRGLALEPLVDDAPIGAVPRT